MKTPLRGIEEWTGHREPEPPVSPSKGILALVILAAVILGMSMIMSSCATLNSIPWSLSYQDQKGETYTITKGAVPIVRPEK